MAINVEHGAAQSPLASLSYFEINVSAVADNLKKSDHLHIRWDKFCLDQLVLSWW